MVEQSNPGGRPGTLIILAPLGPWCTCPILGLGAANVSRLSSATETPASAMHRPIRTRRLKKADFEADFFFMELAIHGVEIALRAAPSEHHSARRNGLLVSSPTTCQHYSFESMENFSKHRDRANKMDSHEVRTTHSMCICVKYASAGGLAW